MASLTDQFEALVRLTAQQVGLLKTLQGILGQINGAVKNLKSGGAGAGPGKAKEKGPEPGMFDKLKEGAGKIGKGLAIGGAVVAGVVAALAAVPLAVVGVVKASENFVRALNPSLLEQYERAQANLSATIGYGLQPVIAYATQALRDWAGILLPSIQQLRPLVERVSAAVSGVGTAIARVFANGLQRFGALVERLLPFFEGMAEALGVAIELWGVLNDLYADWLLSLTDGLDIGKTVADVFRKLAVASVVLVARLLQLAGATESLAKFRQHFQDAADARKNPKSGLTAAPSDAGIGSIEDVLKKLNERAFVATQGGTTKKNETDLLDEINKQLAKVETDPISWKEVIKQAIREAANDANPITMVQRALLGDDASASSNGGAKDNGTDAPEDFFMGLGRRAGASLIGGS